MRQLQFTLLALLVLVLGLTFLPHGAGAQEGDSETDKATKPSTTETVTASINFTTPWGGRIVGALVADRTLVSESGGVMDLNTQWTFNGTHNGHPVTVSGNAAERWTGSPHQPSEVVSTTWNGRLRPPFTSATISQGVANLAYVGPYPVGVDGWMGPPFTRQHYIITTPGKGAGSIGTLPGGRRERTAPSAPNRGTIGGRLEDRVGPLGRRGGPQD